MQVDQERLQLDIKENAEYGAINAKEGVGRTLLTGSEADRCARTRLLNRMDTAGLATRIDSVGNIVGRWVPESADAAAAPVALGSHLDSVPQGGIFDGPLGVYGALEAVRALQSSDWTLTRPVEVVCFTEEEGGRFGIGTLGSSVATGQRPASAALTRTDDEGITLSERLEEIGFAGNNDLDASDWEAWFELHIEQGSTLETTGASVGIVESITGITNCEVTIEGDSNHAGSTPMFKRADALTAAGEFHLNVEAAAEEISTEHPTAVATVGQQTIEPNARNIIPGRVQMQSDIRDISQETIDRLVERCQLSLDRLERHRPVKTTINRYRNSPPSHMSDRCLSALSKAADAVGVRSLRMHSAAMHDTATVADVTETGLLFAPSRDGISHNPREWTDWEDCAVAVGILAEAVATVAADG